MIDIDGAITTFVEEARELLVGMEESLLSLEEDPHDVELINNVFRAAHTIKGSAGLFGFDAVVAFTHKVESLLDPIRGGKIAIDSDCIALLLRCKDHMGALVDSVTGGEAADDGMRALDEELRRGLDAWMAKATGKAAPAAADSTSTTTSPPAAAAARAAAAPSAGEHYDWHISLRFGREVLRNGMDPLGFLRYLGTMGRITHLTTLCDGIPAASEMDPEACYLGFEVTYQSDVDKATIEEAFEFVRDDLLLRIIPQRSKVSEYLQLIDELPESSYRLGEILITSGAITRAELDRGLAQQAGEGSAAAGSEGAPPPHTLGQILVQEGAVDQSVVGAALEKQQRVRAERSQESRFLRVDAEKLDSLINLVGELVIAGAGTQMLARRAGLGELLENTATLIRLVEEVRDGALGLRMVEIGATFQRFHRVVRDVSRELGKDIVLAVSGAETELDKAMVEKIGDPLLHLVRNSMDHGIEPVEERQRLGKTGKATVELNAFHDSGSIVIEVADNGRGLDAAKILKKARERGIVGEGQVLTESEIYSLIFEPGFSTVEKVSDLSGRGVGMDVVRRNIESLRGTVELSSKLGVGTSVRIRLPLTLAIIDGFLVMVGRGHYVIPLDMMVECLELSPELCEMAETRGYTVLRGEVLPCLWLRDLFGLSRSAAVARENIVVVQSAGTKVCVVVDALEGEFQTVIKPLGQLFAGLKGVSGSTILGTGEVALILDVNGVAMLASASAAAVLPNPSTHAQGTLLLS
jgi:two-component system chemotaxis sensor kinase CheA